MGTLEGLKKVDGKVENRNENSLEAESSEASKGKNLGEILRGLVDAGDQSEGKTTSVGDILQAFGNRSYGPLLAAPAMITLLPVIGAIPGLSITMATWILLVAMQMLIHHGTIWLPRRVRGWSVSQSKLARVTEKTYRYIRWMDKLMKPRFTMFCGPPFSYVIALLCIALALTMYPLALVPLGVGPPAATILLFALGLTSHDGLLLILATALTAVSGWFAWYMCVSVLLPASHW